MVTIGLYITLEPERGKPLTLARVSDRQLLTRGTVQAEETAKWRRLLRLLLISEHEEAALNLM